MTDRPQLWSGTVVNVSGAGELQRPKVGVDAGGRAMAVWWEHLAPDQARIMSARHTASGWTPPRIVSASGMPSPPELVVDPQGYATAAWAVYHPTAASVQVARYSPMTDTWGLPVTLAAGNQTPRIAADGVGNVLAVWSGATGLEVSRFSMATGTWALPTTLGPPLSTSALSVNAAGDGVVLWAVGRGVEGKYFLASAGGWFDMPTVPGSSPQSAAIDPTGNVAAVWVESSGGPPFKVVGAWFDRATQRWRTPVVLSTALAPVFAPTAVVDHAGHATAAWRRDMPAGASRVEVVRYSGPTGVLSAVTELGAGGEPALAVDGEGNVTAAWPSSVTPGIVAARFEVQSGSWSAPVQLSDPAGPAHQAQVAADPIGNVTVVWTAYPGAAVIQSTSWLARLGPPTITGVTPAANALTLAFTAPSPVDQAFAPANYEYSVDNGESWSAREPASTASPLVIPGLSDSVRYAVLLRAVNAVGPGLASEPLEAIPGVGCPGPCALVATEVRGNQVTLEWAPPDVGAVPTGYLLEGGLNPGEVADSVSTGGVTPRFTFTVASGSYYVRVHALTGRIRSGPSPEIRIAVNIAARPTPPTDVRGLVDGSSVTVSWRNTFDGGPISGQWLNVNGPATLAVPVPVGENVTVANVPPGTYRVAVFASNVYGTSGVSEAVTLTVPGPCSGVPEAPVNLQVSRQGATLVASWWALPGGLPATGYVVSVSGAWVGQLTTTARVLSAAAAPGAYTVNVAGANPCGVGPTTAPVTIVVP